MHNQIKVSPQLVKIVPQLSKLLKRRTQLPSNLLIEHLLTRLVSLLFELSQFLLSQLLGMLGSAKVFLVLVLMVISQVG